MDIAYGAAGTGCGRCINMLSQGYHDVGVADYGCPITSPRCVALDGNDAPQSQIGARCCTATGCVVTARCRCNLPGSIFRYIVENGLDREKGVENASMGVRCFVSPTAVYIGLSWRKGFGILFAGEEVPGSGFSYCQSISSGGFENTYSELTQMQADTCVGELRGALEKSGISCEPY